MTVMAWRSLQTVGRSVATGAIHIRAKFLIFWENDDGRYDRISKCERTVRERESQSKRSSAKEQRRKVRPNFQM